MNVVAILQARLGSTRLPGKVLMPLGGKPMLQQIIARVQRATSIHKIVVSFPRTDMAIEQCIQSMWTKHTDGLVSCEPRDPRLCQWWGDPNDLVGRYLEAATLYDADLVVRIPCDNPCVDPIYIDQAVQSYLNGCYPFYTNTTALTTNYVAVDGIGCEVFSYNRLQWLDRITKGNPIWREHPHQWFFAHKLVSLPKADVKLDVNTQEEYEYLVDIYHHVPSNFTTEDVLTYLRTKETPHG